MKRNHADIWNPDFDYRRAAADPYEIFAVIADFPSVTFAEDRLLVQLIDYWKGLCKRYPAIGADLNIRVAGSCQLLVEWTHRLARKDSRRLIMVCHTDRDGFWADECHEALSGELLIGARPSGGWEIGRGLQDADVWVVAGSGRDVYYYEGKIVGLRDEQGKSINPSAAGDRRKEVSIPRSIDISVSADVSGNLKSLVQFINDKSQPVTAHYRFSFYESTASKQDAEMEAKLDKRHSLDPATGVIRSSCIDNLAGVAAATSALTRLAVENANTNASVMYTVGEEARMVGLVDLAARMDDSLYRHADAVTWVVVDSSDVAKAFSVGLDSWKSWRLDLSSDQSGSIPQLEQVRTSVQDSAFWDRAVPGETVSCRDDVAAVRLEDRAMIYDLAVARFLFQSALDAREILGDVRSDPHIRRRYKMISPWLASAMLGRPSMFQGGVSEVSVLNMLGDIADALGAKRPRIRCGGIAIPLSNYRNVFGDRGVGPEITHYGAVLSAAAILYSACLTHHHYVFAPSSEVRYVGHAYPNMSQTSEIAVQKTVAIWNDKQTQSKLNRIADVLKLEELTL